MNERFCCFCGWDESVAPILIASPRPPQVYICDKCIDVLAAIVADRRARKGTQLEKQILCPATCDCGEKANHWSGGNIFQCCKCYVMGGNAPADWHPECMSTYQTLNATPERDQKNPDFEPSEQFKHLFTADGKVKKS